MNKPMKLIVGLGNTGGEYMKHRHNVGFMFVDYFIDISEPVRPTFRKFKSDIAEVRHTGEKIWLAKPLTFMNRSGEAVRQIIRNTPMTTNDLIVVHDDLDLSLGSFKIQKGKGPKVHNGIISLEKELGKEDFVRVRVGVDNRPADNRASGEKYVLSDFLPEEEMQVKAVFPDIVIKLFA